MPNISWIAFGGNPISAVINNNDIIETIDWNNITLYEILGEGASGIVHKGLWKNSDKEISVAVKLFKGIATSDGLPEDEMKASIHTGNHPNSTKVYGKLVNCPTGLGLVLELIDPTFKILGLPPSFDSITRDVYPSDFRIELNHVVTVLKGIASICSHLHSRGISHGDLYAHNILVYNGVSLLSDFGAASFYDSSNPHAVAIQGFEVRAFGCLLEELINVALLSINSQQNEIITKLQNLQIRCMNNNPLMRPNFDEIVLNLDTFLI